MKKHYLLLSAAMLLTVAAKAQGTELFFSEYDEGSQQTGQLYNGIESKGQEKAMEIYNPSLAVVNLNAYSIRRYSNGSTTGVNLEEERLMRTTGENTLARRGVFVISNADATFPDIVNNSSQRSAPRQNPNAPNVLQTGGTINFNGNDAMALVRYPSGTAGLPSVNDGVIVDVFGVIGQAPASFTGSTSMPDGNWRGVNPNDPLYPGTTIRPEVRSENQSLRRRPTVETGSRSNAPTVYANGLYASGWNIADEWQAYSYAQVPGTTAATVPPGKDQSYADLGRHEYEGANGAYTSLATLKEFNDGISLYPNPASGTATIEIRGVKVGRLTVLNSVGQSISVQPRGLASEKVTLDISNLRAGLYFVKCESADGQLKIYKELMVK